MEHLELNAIGPGRIHEVTFFVGADSKSIESATNLFQSSNDKSTKLHRRDYLPQREEYIPGRGGLPKLNADDIPHVDRIQRRGRGITHIKLPKDLKNDHHIETDMEDGESVIAPSMISISTMDASYDFIDHGAAISSAANIDNEQYLSEEEVDEEIPQQENDEDWIMLPTVREEGELEMETKVIVADTNPSYKNALLWSSIVSSKSDISNGNKNANVQNVDALHKKSISNKIIKSNKVDSNNEDDNTFDYDGFKEVRNPRRKRR